VTRKRGGEEPQKYEELAARLDHAIGAVLLRDKGKQLVLGGFIYQNGDEGCEKGVRRRRGVRKRFGGGKPAIKGKERL